jgi:alpha-L-arabinofuranosidase
LYTAALLNAFERQGDYVEMACPALFLRRTWHGSTWNNALINHDQAGWFPAQNYVVQKMYRDHYGPQRIATEGGDGLNFLASRSEDGKEVLFKAVNPDAKPRRVELTLGGRFRPASATLRQVVAPRLDTHNTMENPDAVREEEGKVALDGQAVTFTMPPLSVVALTIK